MKTQKMLIGAVVVVAVLVVLFYAFNAYIRNEELNGGAPVEAYRATLSGTQVCLPHKDTSGPQTLECATGLKTDAGEYYALDFSLMSQIPPDISNGERFTASGTVTPVEMLSAEQRYDIYGIFSVTDSVVVDSEPQILLPIDEPPAQGKCYIGGCSSQLCTDRPDMVSTCEYTEAYACYQTATCERQGSGQCGWTPTPALSACLDASGNSPY